MILFLSEEEKKKEKLYACIYIINIYNCVYGRYSIYNVHLAKKRDVSKLSM